MKPPQYESISQYNQPQTLAQILGIHSQNHQLLQQQQQSSQISPFLYLGPLIFSNPTSLIKQQQRVRSNNERHDIQSQEEEEEKSFDTQDSYSIVYQPEEHESVDLSPPPLQQELNYYNLKPRKFKKYQEDDDKKPIPKSIEDLKKRIKIAEIESNDDDLEPPTNLKNHERIARNLSANIRAARDLLSAASEDDYEVKESAPTSRLDFQMHGN